MGCLPLLAVLFAAAAAPPESAVIALGVGQQKVIQPGNVARAIASSGAPGVDVSSGVETAPGVKSAELIRVFVEAARNPFHAEARA